MARGCQRLPGSRPQRSFSLWFTPSIASCWLCWRPATEAWKDAAAQGLTYNQTEVLAYDIAAVLSVPLQIGMYVVGCLWLQRSYRIAVSVSPDYRMRRSVVWVWLGWWVPIVNLWFPFQVVEDVRKATLRGRSMIGAMGSWWTVWLGTVLIDRILTRLTGGTSGDRPLTDAVSLYASSRSQ